MGNIIRDIPVHLREWFKIFERLSYRHQYSTVFSDFMTMTINFFSNDAFKEEMDNNWRRYQKEELKTFNELFFCYIETQRKIFDSDPELKWYDFFGDIYQTISSSSKSSAMGQFFTPASLVDIIVMMQHVESPNRQNINDPACGSGRFLIAWHGHFPASNDYLVAEDLDYMCCQMTCINMLMHGCIGEVIWHNTLMLDDYKGGWLINPYLRWTGIPSIVPMKKHQAYIFRNRIESTPTEPAKVIRKEEQMKLF